MALTSVNTVSISTSVVCPGANFLSTDVNKLMEVINGGAWCGVSNQTLIAFITSVSSPSNITLSAAAGVTANGLTGCYGTDDAVGFSKAIAHARRPTATIVIPSGNYLIAPREAIYGYPGNVAHVHAVQISRGGLTFEGQGNVVLTQSGWVRNGFASSNGNAAGERGAMFCFRGGMTDNYPVVFSNLTFYGGETSGWIHNISFPSSNQTGLGWDESHHAISFEYGNGGNFVDSFLVENCVFHGWRGEVLITTAYSTNTFMTISNSLFYDDNATALNVGFGHNWTTCLFSNMNQVEEFYRDYATSFASTMQNCVITNAGVVALNGSYYGCPTYTIVGNSFYGNGWALETTPACDVVFESNNVCTAQGIAIGVAGYQSLFGVCNSNIVAADNIFNGCQYALDIFGSGNNAVEDVSFVSNQVDNAWGIGGGYGWSTNVFVYNNVCSNVGRFNESGLQGQWFLDQSNNYNGTCLNTPAW